MSIHNDNKKIFSLALFTFMVMVVETQKRKTFIYGICQIYHETISKPDRNIQQFPSCPKI